MVELDISALNHFLDLQYGALGQLEIACDALNNLERLFSACEGKFIDRLREQKNQLLILIEYHQERFRASAALLEEYLDAVRALFHPIDSGNSMIIDVKGFAHTINDIEKIIGDLYNTIIHVQCNSFPQRSLYGEMAALNQEINQHNMEVVDKIRQNCVNAHTELIIHHNRLKEIYWSYFHPFEQAEKEFAERALALCHHYVDEAIMKQLGDEDAVYRNTYAAESFGKAVVDGVVGAGEFIWGGIETTGALAYGTWAILSGNEDNVPDWVNNRCDIISENVDKIISFLDDPGRGINNIATGIHDGLEGIYDEHGTLVAFAVVGGTLFDPFKGFGKGTYCFKVLKTGKVVLISASEIAKLKRRLHVNGKMSDLLAKRWVVSSSAGTST